MQKNPRPKEDVLYKYKDLSISSITYEASVGLTIYCIICVLLWHRYKQISTEVLSLSSIRQDHTCIIQITSKTLH